MQKRKEAMGQMGNDCTKDEKTEQAKLKISESSPNGHLLSKYPQKHLAVNYAAH